MASTLQDQPSEFWFSLLVDIETVDTAVSLRLYLEDRLTTKDLEVLEKALGLPSGDAHSNMERAEFISEYPLGVVLRKLRSFGITAKRTTAINEVWKLKGHKETLHPLAKLTLLYADNPQSLWDVLVQDCWRSKSSGTKFVSDGDNKVSLSKVTDPGTLAGLVAEATKTTGFKLRIVRTFLSDKQATVLLYREDPRIVEGFESPVRLPRARQILFQVQETADNVVLTIKAQGQSVVERSIREFVSVLFGTSFTARPDRPFAAYEKDDVAAAFAKGGNTRDLIIRSIGVRSYNLKGNPILSVTADEGKDAGDAFADLVKQNQELVNITSLKDFSGIEVEIGEKHNYRRISVEGYDTSEVRFSLPDHGLTPETVSDLSNKFKARFGLPLNQEIDHRKFAAGQVAVYDFLLSCENDSLVPKYQLPVLAELQNQHLVTKGWTKRFQCSSCDSVFLDEGKCQQHPDSSVFEIEPVERLLVQEEVVRDRLQSLLGITDWELGARIEHKINRETYKFFRLTKVSGLDIDREVWVYPAFGVLSKTDFLNLKSMLTPVLVVWVGKARLSRYVADVATLKSITFGQLLVWSEHSLLDRELGRALSEVVTDAPAKIEFAAASARENLTKLLIPGPVLNYTADQFEHDVYILLKQMFPLTVCLGNKRRGLAVPDGLIDFWVDFSEVKPFMYMYDAKLNLNGKGYDLDLDEERKAWDYLFKAHNSDVLRDYILRKPLTGYLFISNKFKQDDPEYIAQFLDPRIDWGGKVSFLSVDNLLSIHEKWMRCRDSIVGKSNGFKKMFAGLIEKASRGLSEAEISKAFATLVDRQVGIPQTVLDVDQFVEEITEGSRK